MEEKATKCKDLGLQWFHEFPVQSSSIKEIFKYFTGYFLLTKSVYLESHRF